ncbi:ABC transporter substrate-binding protein [Gorillibacterium timonense]|uniref:ABC transporter substrate-binding protein n=1 Tax=Gorillibacterium timonense TaxID=1689269 RepID=UPI00071D98EB|nr:ABC transporter substrate-binding protein [Gorillibacterium timonense]
MKLRKQFGELRSRFQSVPEHTPLEITTAELAEMLQCTPRTMITLLQRMQEEGWLSWVPKRGRANRSELVFTVPLQRVILEEAEELVEKNNMQAALELLRSTEMGPGSLTQEWLARQFGVQTVRDGHRRSDMLRFPLPQIIHTLDPAKILFSGESHLVQQLFDGLVRSDSKGGLHPHAAHAWEADSGRTQWTFYLRKGIRFQHGRELTSEDVRYTLDRLIRLAPHGLFSWVYRGIEKMETPDEYTVRIKLDRPNELFPAFLASSRASLVPKDLCEELGDQFGQHPTGTGPYRLAERYGDVWSLVAFEDYFQGRGFLDRIEVWTFSEEKLRLQSVPAPSFQLMHNVRLPEREAGSWQEIRQTGMTCKFLTVPHKPEGVLTDPVLRAAFNRLLNRELLLERLSGDVVDSVDSFWPVRTIGEANAVCREEGNACGSEDPKLGMEPGLPPLKLITIPEYEKDAKLIREVCAEVGVSIELELLSAEDFNSEKRLTADLLLFAVTLDEQRELRLIDLFTSIRQHADHELGREMTSLMNEIRCEVDPEIRIDLFLEIEELLDQSHTLLFLYRKSLKTAFHPSIRGVSLESLGWVRFRDIWFTDKKDWL